MLQSVYFFFLSLFYFCCCCKLSPISVRKHKQFKWTTLSLQQPLTGAQEETGNWDLKMERRTNNNNNNYNCKEPEEYRESNIHSPGTWEHCHHWQLFIGSRIGRRAPLFRSLSSSSSLPLFCCCCAFGRGRFFCRCRRILVPRYLLLPTVGSASPVAVVVVVTVDGR